MSYTNRVEGGEIVVFVDTALYSKDSIFKCVYWYGAKYRTNLSYVTETVIRVSLKSLTEDSLSEEQYQKLLQKLERDLIDFNLRDIVSKETKNIRDLLTAKAFSNGEFDEIPPGDPADPVGFDVNKV